MSVIVENQVLFSGLSRKEEVEECLKVLIKENQTRVNKLQKMIDKCVAFPSNVNLLSLKSTAAKYIIQLCNIWKCSVEVMFAAIEMYYQFVVFLLSEIFNTIFKLPKDEANGRLSKRNLCNIQSKQWNETIEHIVGQMELRAVTCVAIASKCFSSYSHISFSVALNFLSSGGKNYSADVLLKSEIRILRTLKFNVSSLPLVLPYVSVLLNYLLFKDNSLNGSEIYHLSVDLLICFYSCSHQIYQRYLKDVDKANLNIDHNNAVVMVAKDMVILSCGVLASATYLWCKKKSDSVIKILSDTAAVSAKAIAKFSFIILEESLH